MRRGKSASVAEVAEGLSRLWPRRTSGWPRFGRRHTGRTRPAQSIHLRLCEALHNREFYATSSKITSGRT